MHVWSCGRALAGPLGPNVFDRSVYKGGVSPLRHQGKTIDATRFATLFRAGATWQLYTARGRSQSSWSHPGN
eukprot:2745420-Pyramimonas_sp.AAC.1